MIPTATINPFRPGTGQIPPAFPGRQTEQNHFQDILNELQQQHSPSRDTLICAPRGNGKTALLNWLVKQTKQNNKYSVDIIKTTPDKIETITDLLSLLALPGWTDRIRTALGRNISLGYADLQIEVKTPDNQNHRLEPHLLTENLLHRCTKTPTILIIDEAHNLVPTIAQHLLTTSQEIKEQAPFHLILAGTPGLRDHLNNTKATFWERNHKIYPGLLTPEQSENAVFTPLHHYNITTEKDTAQQIIEDIQGYPYFSQLWGAALFKTLQAQRTTHIDDAITTQAHTMVETQRQSFYADRYNALRKQNLLTPAYLIANYFTHNQAIEEQSLSAILSAEPMQDHSDLSPETARDKLIHEGYIWQSDPLDQSQFHQGIPSFMHYFLHTIHQRKAPENAK